MGEQYTEDRSLVNEQVTRRGFLGVVVLTALGVSSFHRGDTPSEELSKPLEFKKISVSGTPEQRGRQHGQLLADEIKATFSHYRDLLGYPDSELEQKGNGYREAIRKFAPEYARELEAVAEAAGVPEWQIYVINARSEILSQKIAVGECSALYLPEGGVLAQNWDWTDPMSKLALVIETEHDNGLRSVSLTEPGMLAKVGLNSAGLGVCINFLSCDTCLDSDRFGVPIQILIRKILDCTDVQSAEKILREAPRNLTGHLLIADASGKSISVEFAGEELWIEEVNTPLGHTNHYLRTDVENRPLDYPNSYARIRTMNALLENNSSDGVQTAKDVLLNSDHAEYPICQPMHYDEYIGSMGTIATVIMDIPERKLHIAHTPGTNPNFRTHSVR